VPETSPTLSIVIPAYNEEHRLPETLRAAVRFCEGRRVNYEVIVVDDGSTDGTREAAEAFLREGYPVEVLRNGANRGKGYAVRVGSLAARGRFVLLADADLSTPIEEISRLLPWAQRGTPVVIGSRKIPGAHILRHQPAWREWMGKVFSLLARKLLVPEVADFTCGFKLFHGEWVGPLFRRLRRDDWTYDAELLYVARRLGLAIKEVPITWADDPDSRVRPLRAAARSLCGLLAIRLNGLFGRYD
jgi:dolichyl-phosphate beta-glucosyltransferase